MTGHRRLTKSLNELDSSKQNVSREFPGILGAQFKGQTLVEVPNRSGYVYVRLRSNTNEIIQAFNETVSPVYGLPVNVIRDTSHNRYYIKSRDLGQYQNWGSSSYQPRHGAQHSFSDNGWGGDIVWVYDRQFVPLLVSPPSGSTSAGSVYIYPDTINKNGIWYYAGNELSPNLLSNKPTDNQALLILVYLDVSGTVQYSIGSSFSASYIYTNQILPYIPALPSDAIMPLAAVRLVSGTSTISWNEIYDLRPIVGGDITITGTFGTTVSGVKQTIFTFPGTLSVSYSPLRIYNKFGETQTISQVFLSVGTAPDGDDIIVDIHKDGTTIFTNQAHRPAIADGSNTGFTTDIDVADWDDGEYLLAYIDQIGTGTAGSDLVVQVVHS